MGEPGTTISRRVTKVACGWRVGGRMWALAKGSADKSKEVKKESEGASL